MGIFKKLLLVAVVIAVLVFLYRGNATSSENISVMSLLKSEPMAFLVTRRITTQIVVEESNANWYSHSRAVMWATVRLHYGCDLEQIKSEDIRKGSDGVYIIRLPPPQLLDFSVDHVNSISKDTFFAKAQDVLYRTRSSRMRKKLREDAMAFASQNGMLPSREQMVADLNNLLKSSAMSTIKVKFE